jgi:two-component system, chemotaxis family, CheB/CheR fusion protein
MVTTNEGPSVPSNEPAVLPGRLNFPVVGLGASAGGLPALLQFFEHMPADNGMAFVVVLHLSPKHQSSADAVIQRATRMPVSQVTMRTVIEPNHVYVIPPNKHLTMSDGHLCIEGLVRPVGHHVAIDLFFRTLADAHKDRAVAVVLSGTGSDGAVGLARIKEQGGVAIVQSPGDAEHDAMPLAAIASTAVDFILPVAEIPQKLIALWENARRIELPPFDDHDAPVLASVTALPDRSTEEALHDIITVLRARSGHDFRHYKRATVLRRLERRLQVRALPDLKSYRDLLKTDVAEAEALLKDMLIGVTNFFRDRDAFEALERDVIPRLFDGKLAGDQVRAWVAACSTGEEAYSVAMLLREHANLLSQPVGVQVFATDIDERAIGIARSGTYPSSIVTDVPPPRLREFFSKEENRYRIKKAVRDDVLFAAHNLLRDPPFSKLDLISCRNLLIYLNRDIQERVLEIFHFALSPGGFLFLGSSESAEAAGNLFTPVDKKHRIYRARAQARALRSTMFTSFGGTVRRSTEDARSTPANRPFSFAEIHQRVLSQYAPPSVIVNHESNIVHMSDRAGRFLRHAGGEPSRNLVSLVQPELRLELRTALFQALQSGRSVEARRVRIEREGRVYYVNMTARPFRDADAAAEFVLVLFDEVEQTMGEEPRQNGAKEDAVLHQLEEELQRTKEHLQETIEQSETSTEELKASNEELQAINEELRSATEELETSKEELQSVNEELITVNYELKVKVEETSKVNDDLSNLIASTNIATVFVDKGMRIKRFTPRAVDVFSIIPSDVGRSLLDITHRLDYEQLGDDLEQTFESLGMVEREVMSNDGKYYIARLLPYRTVDDRIEGAVLAFIDITRRHQAEEDLRAGEERMRLVVESTKDYAIITTDPDGVITSWNKGAARMFGYPEQEVLGQSIDLIFVPEDRANGIPADERARARAEGRAEDERWHARKDGLRIYCSGVMTPLQDSSSQGYAKIARDLTARVQAGNARVCGGREEHEATEESQAASVFKDEFLAVMSHELKNSLNLIHINADLLSRLPEVRNSSISIKAAHTIREASISQAKIINDLLDLSRLNTGKLALTMSEVNLSQVVASLVDVVRHDPDAARLRISVTDRNPPAMVKADLVRVEQVVWNLLSNAVKFTRDGEVTVELIQEPHAVRLEVTDTGKGIAPEFLPHVFNMFAQGAQVPGANRGMGIGLTLSKQIMELHGGHIEATSAGLGRGARVSVVFPRRLAVTSTPEPAAATVERSPAGVRALVVDDVPDFVTTLKMLLEMGGLAVETATSGEEGLMLLRQQQFDIVLSDITMPEMDGYAFIAEIRKLPGLAALPVIAITGMGRQKDVDKAYGAGFSAHVSKPVSFDVLLDTILRFCRPAAKGTLSL